MTEQKNSSEKTEKTDRKEKPGSAPKKPSIEPKSARGASTTARRKTAKEADDALQDKIEKARAGAMPERREPAAAGESAGLPPVQTVRAMPQINRKKDETTSDEKAVAKKPSAPVKMPERDATGRFLPSEEKAKKPRAKARAQQARTEDVKKPSEKPEAKPAQKTAQKSEPKETQKAPKQVEPKVETKTESQPAQKTQEAKAAKKPEGPVTSAAPAAPVPHVKPVLSLLMDEAPSGVMTDMKADDRPAPGEVRGKPADETNEAPSSPVLRPSDTQSPNGSRIIDIDGEEDEEEDYDDIPDPAVSVSESADDNEIDDDEPDDDDDQSSADRPVKKPVSVIRPAAEDPEPVELDSQGRPYHATEVLSGRRTPVRVKPPVEEPADPSRTVDLEAERIDAEHTARQALLRLHARTQPTRAELASMLVSRKIEQMERGNPAFEKDPSQEGDSDSVPDRNEDARSKGWNSLWENGVRDAAAEQNALVDVRRPPRYAFDEDERPQVERDEAYARRMDAWEKDVMAESESRDQRVSCRGPKPGPRVPVRTGTHETLGGFPTPHQTRAWKAEGGEEEERESRLDIVRERLNRLHERWSGLEGCLRAALAVACVSSVAAFAAWTTAKSVVPDLTVMHTPVSVTAVVADEEIRNLMLMTALLDARGIPTGRTAPQVDSVYLTGELRKIIVTDNEASRMSLPLDDRLFRAVVMEAADMAGAPVLSRAAVLAMPDPAHSTTGRTLDVTNLVIERLGLKNVSAAAAREVVSGLMSPSGLSAAMTAVPSATTSAPSASAEAAPVKNR